MSKMEAKKESISFNFEKNKQKQNFFDKAKKCNIINNYNSVFLHKILSVKNQSLLNGTLKKYPSDIFKKVNTSSDAKKSNAKNNMNKSMNRNSQTTTFKQRSLTNLFDEINNKSPQVNSSNSKINIFSPKLISSKIIVNKNKHLGIYTQKEKDKVKETEKKDENDKDEDNNKENEKVYLNTYFNKNNTINSKRNQQEKDKPNLNNEFCQNPEISFSNLYTSKYIRKPVVIKFNNLINPININNTTNTYNTTINNNNSTKYSNNSYNYNTNQQQKNFSTTFQEEENKENIFCKERIKTDEIIKPYNFYEKSMLKPELYRSYEDLEKKSMEISRRKMIKDSSSILNFKKNTNLEDVKESLEQVLHKSKSKNIDNDIKINTNKNINKKEKKIINKNKSLKNVRKIKTKEIFIKSLKEEENEKNDFCLNNTNLNLNINNYWQEQRNIHYNNINNDEIKNNNTLDLNMQNQNYQNLTNIKCENILYNEENNRKKNKGKFFVKKKNISINFIEDNKSENVYNIPLNDNELIYNNYNNSLKYRHKTNDKHSLIRKKYGKKNNVNKIFEDCKIQFKSNRKDINRGNKTSLVTKTFIEDYKVNDNILSNSQSQLFISKQNLEKQIKVNKKSNSSHKAVKRIINKNLPYIIEEEERLKNEIRNNLNTINGIEIISNLFNLKNKNNLKDKFEILLDYSIQMKSFSNSTLLTSISQNTGLRYIKKIIPINTKINKENVISISKHNIKANFATKNYFNIEKQKMIILKRKELGFFERYEHCLDFIENFRNDLLKFILNSKKNI